jgi:hypothetical protein
MELEYNLELQDYRDYAAYSRTVAKPPQTSYYWYYILPGLVVAIAVFTGSNILVAFGIVAAFAVASLVHQKYYARAYYAPHYSQERLDGLIGKRKIKLTSEGFIETSARCDLIYRWRSTYSVVSTANVILFYVGPIQAFIIPKRIFASEQDSSVFVSALKEYIAAAQ